MDKYSKIQVLIDEQKKKKDKIVEILEEVLGFLPKIEIEFENKNKDLIKLKVKDKSSVRFVVLQNKEKIVLEFKKCFTENLVVL